MNATRIALALKSAQTHQEVTQAYSRQAVSWAAQRAGWTLKQTAANKFTVTRR